eukprot:TRINITY_DN7403_c0_g2_i2.p1 TRINITY_DN7403_c0_g2~~TRINITY_DN7403_c0_g2_i2.p1  ORF type:complete len:386 (+),score=79.16 TRINITY_DN7403_c0_g2_i2:125-1282(+)
MCIRDSEKGIKLPFGFGRIPAPITTTSFNAATWGVVPRIKNIFGGGGGASTTSASPSNNTNYYAPTPQPNSPYFNDNSSDYSPYSPLGDDEATRRGADGSQSDGMLPQANTNPIHRAPSSPENTALPEALLRLRKAEGDRKWEAFCMSNQVCIVAVQTGNNTTTTPGSSSGVSPASSSTVDGGATTAINVEDIDDGEEGGKKRRMMGTVAHPVLVVRVPMSVVKKHFDSYQSAVYRFHERGIEAVLGSTTSSSSSPSSSSRPSSSRIARGSRPSGGGVYSAADVLNTYAVPDEDDDTGKYVDLKVRPEDVMIPRRSGMIEVCINGMTLDFMGNKGKYDELAKRLAATEDNTTSSTTTTPAPPGSSSGGAKAVSYTHLTLPTKRIV